MDQNAIDQLLILNHETRQTESHLAYAKRRRRLSNVSFVFGPVAGAENLCHQAVFMNHAADAVTSLNPEPVKVGDVAGQPAQRRGLLQGSVRPVGVVEVFVLPQHGHKVALVPYQSPVEQFAAAAADPPFHDRVHSGRLDGGADDPGAAARKTSSNAVLKLASRS